LEPKLLKKKKKKKKKDFQDFTDGEAEAKLILEKECDDDTTLKVTMLPKDLKVKLDKLAMWIEIKGNPDPVSSAEWTLEDQSKVVSSRRVTSQLKKRCSVNNQATRKRRQPCAICSIIGWC
jgi:hypothetical protein